ncbi:forkhead box protein I1c-like [Anthonomus grandis grandis]|uniref:forkhead box protein I1c-like n=1 Tax=Anthonomus grandis grandis TaxID=2921223 RepID=UPI002165CBCC|nr:forkhead box protein I1c-like [Anthonomus grandis grandis]
MNFSHSYQPANFYAESYQNIKIEFHDPTDTGRIVSQTFSRTERSEEPLTKARKILNHVQSSGNNLPRISIKSDDSSEKYDGEVVLLNGNSWDPCGKQPYNKMTELLSSNSQVQTQDYTAFNLNGDFERPGSGVSHSQYLVSPSPRGSDSGIESDCTDGNLSWLLNYKIRELPPVPDSGTIESTVSSEEKIVKIVTPQQPLNEVVINEGFNPNNNLPKKPPFTYTELIEHALSEKGELTVSGIYNWISNHFPFYKSNDDRWKNSVRHNLSINPHFRKGGKPVHGAGHLWTIAQRDESKTWQMRQRINEFLKHSKQNIENTRIDENQDPFDQELQAATDSILEEIQSQNITESINNSSAPNEHNIQINNDIQVEFINLPDGVTGLEGFLSPPVSKQDIVNECGLGSDFFITDINPNQLGLSLVETETGDDRLYEEMSLEYYGIKE